MRKVLLVASGHSATEFYNYPYRHNGWTIVAINNAWRVIEGEWDYWVRTDDCPRENGRPDIFKPHQTEVVGRHYAKMQNEFFGGHDACGWTVSLNASYWALGALRPSVMGYLGADMNYTPDAMGNTSAYGVGIDIRKRGIPDPDQMIKRYGKGDPQYLTDKFNRLEEQAKLHCDCILRNFSSIQDTRLPYEKASPSEYTN